MGNHNSENKAKDVKPKKEIKMVEGYVGDFVILDTERGSNVRGLLSGITNRHAELMPYVFMDHSEEGVNYTLIRQGKPRSITIDTIVGVTPTTEEEVKGFCAYQNQLEALAFLRLQLEKKQLGYGQD